MAFGGRGMPGGIRTVRIRFVQFGLDGHLSITISSSTSTTGMSGDINDFDF